MAMSCENPFQIIESCTEFIIFEVHSLQILDIEDFKENRIDYQKQKLKDMQIQNLENLESIIFMKLLYNI